MAEQKDAQISGNKNRKGIERLVDVGYVNCHAISVDAEVYEITDVGRSALIAARERNC
jgi:hypothetical protein